jgi:hypothetical protein
MSSCNPKEVVYPLLENEKAAPRDENFHTSLLIFYSDVVSTEHCALLQINPNSFNKLAEVCNEEKNIKGK